MIYELFLLGSYFSLGALTKIVDQVFDAKLVRHAYAYLAAACIIFLAGYWIATDTYSQPILLAIVFAMLISGKVDNMAFWSIAISLITVAILLAVLGIIEIQWFSLWFLILTAVIDEFANDLADSRKRSSKAIKFFYYRPFMKIGVLMLAVWGYLSIVYLAAFVLFDMAYVIIGKVQKHYHIEGIRGLYIKPIKRDYDHRHKL